MFQFVSLCQKKQSAPYTGPLCVCRHRYNKRFFKLTIQFVRFQDSRGVWHLHPTTRNEAVDESGKGNLASFLYLQIVELLMKLSLFGFVSHIDFVFHILPSKLPGFLGQQGGDKNIIANSDILPKHSVRVLFNLAPRASPQVSKSISQPQSQYLHLTIQHLPPETFDTKRVLVSALEASSLESARNE